MTACLTPGATTKQLLIATALMLAGGLAHASGKSADECEAEVGPQASNEARQAKMIDCMLGNSAGTTKLFRSPFKGEKWFCEVAKGASCEADYQGTLNGVQFSQKFDGSGWVQATTEPPPYRGGLDGRWMISCKKDAMTSRSSCNATLDDLWLFADHTGRIKVSVGYDNFPGAQTSLRIDSRRFDTLDNDGDFPQSAEIVRNLKDGRTLVTRYMKWPYRSHIDRERILYGAEATIQLLTWSARNFK
jgi:hypothetical protein